MDQNIHELTGIAVIAFGSILMGLLLVRFRQPPIVGYIIAGVILGPAGLGFVSGSSSIRLLAELGVLMLLFLIGMEISVRAFLVDLRPALLTVLGQVGISAVVASGLAFFFNWNLQQLMLFSFVIALSSTAVALKVLEDIGELRTDIGRIVVAVMIAQDIVVVPVLILARGLGGDGVISSLEILKVIVAMIGLGFLVAVLGRRGKFRVPFSDLISERVELTTLAALALCFSFATVTGLLGLSPIYGAFIAGLIIANTNLRSEAIQAMHPIQSLLIMVFFVSVGLLLDINFIWNNIGLVLFAIANVMLIKTVVNVLLLRLVGQSPTNAFTAGLLMAQVGEFSFVIAAVGFSNGVLDFNAYRLAIAIIALSLLLSPLWIVSIKRVQAVAAIGIDNFRQSLTLAYTEEMIDKGPGQPFRLAHLYTLRRSHLRALRRSRSLRQGSVDDDQEPKST